MGASTADWIGHWMRHAWHGTRRTLKLSRNQVNSNNGKRIADRLRGLEGLWRSKAGREQWLRDDAGSFSQGEDWDRAKGTTGAGNHFAEVQVVESISISPDGNLGLHHDEVVLLVHSGSRGYGGSILKKYALESHASLEEGTEQMMGYMREHDQARDWVKANRDLITLQFLSCLELSEEAWELGRNQLDCWEIEDYDDYRLLRPWFKKGRSSTCGTTISSG